MRYAIVYGVLAGAIAVGVIVAELALHLPRQLQSEWFGYLVMLVALSLIFVGVKRYRDVECGGVIRFGRAFAVGLGIAVVAGLVYVAGWEAYQSLSGIDYIGGYSDKVLAEMRSSGASPREIATQAAELRELAANYRNPLWRLPMVFAEIFPVGLVVSLISAAVLRNPRVLPGRAA
jgi:hypothetical protein